MADGNIDLENAILQEVLNMGCQITPEQLDEIKGGTLSFFHYQTPLFQNSYA